MISVRAWDNANNVGVVIITELLVTQAMRDKAARQFAGGPKQSECGEVDLGNLDEGQ